VTIVQTSLILTQKAEQDLDDAFQWYERQDPGLGKEFIRCLDARIAALNRHPLHYPIILNEHVRRAILNRFPFSIYFINEEALITIFAILHQRRNPDFWKSRL
jgi:plasmid stabilization system protein ParE